MSVFDDMVEFLDTAWCARDQIVPCLQGPVGIGKTAAVKKHAENVGAKKVVSIIASQILPNEVSGITMPDSDTKAMEIYDHFRLSSLEDGDILFFDELLEADQLVLSACLTLIESRQLMSGKQLPDIQIVAATNPTIKSNMLRDNIRQRFLFKFFPIDKEGCRKYIKQEYGFDIGYELAQQIQSTGDSYNILTQRSLTKMAHWISKAGDDTDQAKRIAKMIDSVWGSNIGTQLYKAYKSNPLVQVRSGIQRAVAQAGVINDINDVADILYDIDDKEFTESSIAEVMEVLKKLPNWNDIENMLSSMQVEDEVEVVSF